MSAARLTRRFSLETKVMAAVLAVLIILPAVTLLSVNRQMYAQMQRDAELALSTARQSFLQGMRIHSKELKTRFLPGLGDYRFLRILRLNDAATLKDHLLREHLQVYADDTELAAFFGANGE